MIDAPNLCGQGTKSLKIPIVQSFHPHTYTRANGPPQCSPLMAIYSAMAIITDDAQGQH